MAFFFTGGCASRCGHQASHPSAGSEFGFLLSHPFAKSSKGWGTRRLWHPMQLKADDSQCGSMPADGCAFFMGSPSSIVVVWMGLSGGLPGSLLKRSGIGPHYLSRFARVRAECAGL